MAGRSYHPRAARRSASDQHGVPRRKRCEREPPVREGRAPGPRSCSSGEAVLGSGVWRPSLLPSCARLPRSGTIQPSGRTREFPPAAHALGTFPECRIEQHVDEDGRAIRPVPRTASCSLPNPRSSSSLKRCGPRRGSHSTPKPIAFTAIRRNCRSKSLTGPAPRWCSRGEGAQTLRASSSAVGCA